MALPTNTGAFIHNGVNCTPNTIQTAQGVPYDNTSSGLSATNVQGAIDEVKGRTLPIFYGWCTNYASDSVKVITLYDSDEFQLIDGVIIAVRFANSNSANHVWFNVNDTGQYPAYSIATNTPIDQESWSGQAYKQFIFVDNAWHMADFSSNNKVYQSYDNSTSSSYPLLMAYSTATYTETNGSRKSSRLKFQPSTGTLISTNLSVTSINGIKLSGFTNNAGFHNSIYRGKNLGTAITEEQYAQISTGTFDDLFIGDYWAIETTVGGTVYTFNYTIAAFDYWYMVDDDSTPPVMTSKHHIALYIEQGTLTARMNGTNITTGGYLGSEMYTTNLNNMRNGISDLFGNHVYPVPRYFTNSVNSSGQANGYACTMSTLDLMSETMVYGHSVWGTSGFEVGVDKTILPIFALNPFKAFSSNNSGSKTYYWLSSVASSTHFSLCNGTGVASYSIASAGAYLKPIFALKGDTD